jgi:AcrR family transcriptional regulator
MFDDRRSTILAAALAAFSERGYEATTIADVRRSSKASVGSIYHHFGDKRGIAASLFVECVAAYQATLATALEGEADAERGIRGVVLAHLDWVRANPQRAGFMLERREPEVAEASAARLRGLNLEFFEVVRAWMAPHVRAGEMRRLPLELFYVIVLGPSQELSRLWLRDPDPKRLAAARRALPRAAWDAVRVPNEGG